MVTPEEIGEVQILGALSPDERERLSRVGGRHPPGGGRVRGQRRRRTRTLRRPRRPHRGRRGSSTGSSASSAGAAPATSSGRCRSRSARLPGRVSRGRTARVMRLDAPDYNGSRPSRPTSAWRSGRWRASGSAGSRASPPNRLRRARRRRAALGSGLRGLRRFLDRNQVTFTLVGPRAPDAEASGVGRCRATEDRPLSASSTGRRSCART